MRVTPGQKQRGILVALLLGLAGCGGNEQATVDITAADYRPTTLLQAVLLGDRLAVEQFLAQGADVNATEVDGTTPLMRAVHGRFPQIATRLLAAGANASAANRYGVTALYLAARGGDAVSARALLAAGANANSSLPEGETVLMTAAKAGSTDIVRALLTGGTESLADLAGDRAAANTDVVSGYGSGGASPVRNTNRADVNAREGWYGQTALMWAAAEGHADIVRLLIEAGANIDDHSQRIGAPEPNPERAPGAFVYPSIPHGRLTALHFAAREGQLDAVQALIDGGADLDAVDEEGANALIYATRNSHLDVARLLLEAGANPNVADAYGRTVLFVATDLNTHDGESWPQDPSSSQLTPVDIVGLALAKGANPDPALTKGLPDYSAQGSLRDPILNEGATPFFRAAMSADLAVMQLLLKAGAEPLVTTAARSPTERPSSGQTTSLMAAAGVGWRESIGRGRESDTIKALELLLARGADINAANQMGDTALHGAALRGSTAIIQFLVDHGANVRAKNAKGQTPLDIAVGVPNEAIPYNEAAATLLRRLSQRA